MCQSIPIEAPLLHSLYINIMIGVKMERIIKDLEELVEYMWAEENKNWEELDNPAGHIFLAINNVRNYLESIKQEKNHGKNREKRI